MISEEQHWENVYLTTLAENLPWNAGGPDSDLVRYVESGRIPVGQALDIGTGPGHDAVFLISKGFNVIAIDISKTAIQLARETASHAGVFGFFQEGDIRGIPIEDDFVDFANDRGCFHVLNVEDQQKAISEIHRVLARRGLFLLRVFSEKETSPAGTGPHRFSRAQLETLFLPKFTILDIQEGIFEGPRRAASYVLLMEKR